MTSCYDKAVDLLSRRAHFEAELELKLRRRGFAQSQISETVERLRERGLLDDDRCAEELVRVRRRRGVGRRKLAAELSRRGLDSERVSQHLMTLSADEELDDARRVAAQWQSRRGDGRAGAQALARHLDRRGFGKSVILTILDELSSGGSLPDERPLQGDPGGP